MVAAGRAAVAAARVEVAEVLAGLDDRRGLVLLLDVHVERVEVQHDVLRADGLDEGKALVRGVEEVGLKAVQRLDAQRDVPRSGEGGEHFQVLHDERELHLLLLRLHGVGLAHDGVNRTDEARAAHDGGLVHEGLAVSHRSGLLLGRAAEVTARAHAGADGTDGKPGLVGGGLHLHGVDMLRRLDGNLDGLKTPFLKLGEELHALGGERGGVEECVDAKSHNAVS